MKRIAVLFAICLYPVLLQAQELSPAARTLVFSHVTVIDATGAGPASDETVIVQRGRILRIGSSKSVPVPRNAQVVDASGLYVIPGLWDMHVHVWETDRSFPMLIANGVTGVRNMGGHLDALKSWRDQIGDGALLGPRLILCGPVVDSPNPSHPDHSVVIHDPAEGRNAVDFLKANGADFVKVYDGVARDEYFAIADEAKRQGIPFVGHVPEAISPSEASNAGQASIEHLSGIVDAVSTKYDEIRAIRASL